MGMDLFKDMEGGFLVKVGVFAIVQLLVYLILSGPSGIFSKERAMKRSASFRTVRSISIRRLLAALSDMPAGGEFSPTAVSRTISQRSCEAMGESKRQGSSFSIDHQPSVFDDEQSQNS
ncbi:uncharacterized protein LOC144713690 [Wolffia australiana]